MVKRKTIRTIADLAAHYGGTAELAARVGTSQQNVCNWLANDEIPRGWHYLLHLVASLDGVEIDRKVFGVTPDVYRALARGGGVPARP